MAPACSAVVTDAMLGTATASDNCPGLTVARSGVPAGNVFPVGTTILTYTATDASGNTSSPTQPLTVVDDTPPSITGASADPPVLWPPNHKMVRVTVPYDSTDACTTPTSSLAVSVKETRAGDRDHDDDPDWEIIDAHHVRLRAERSGDAQERIYTITITCRDGVGNKSTQKVTVRVPHDQGQGR